MHTLIFSFVLQMSFIAAFIFLNWNPIKVHTLKFNNSIIGWDDAEVRNSELEARSEVTKNTTQRIKEMGNFLKERKKKVKIYTG